MSGTGTIKVQSLRHSLHHDRWIMHMLASKFQVFIAVRCMYQVVHHDCNLSEVSFHYDCSVTHRRARLRGNLVGGGGGGPGEGLPPMQWCLTTLMHAVCAVIHWTRPWVAMYDGSAVAVVTSSIKNMRGCLSIFSFYACICLEFVYAGPSTVCLAERQKCAETV